MTIGTRIFKHHKNMIKLATDCGYEQKYTMYGNSADVYEDEEYLPLKYMMECISVQNWLEGFGVKIWSSLSGDGRWLGKVKLKECARVMETHTDFDNQGHALLSAVALAIRLVFNLPTAQNGRG